MRRRTHLKTQINKNRRGNPAHGGQLREQPDPRIAARANRTGVARDHRPPSRSVKARHLLPNDRAGERRRTCHTKSNKSKFILAAGKTAKKSSFPNGSPLGQTSGNMASMEGIARVQHPPFVKVSSFPSVFI